jgi:mono/diheme cytochrome c family protein
VNASLPGIERPRPSLAQPTAPDYGRSMLTVLLLTDSALAADPAAGKAIYAANCTACHGVAGDGKGPAAIALRPKPTDFTVAAWWADKTDEQLVATIRSGRPGTSMTGFTQIPEADVANVVAYLRTFPAPKP